MNRHIIAIVSLLLIAVMPAGAGEAGHTHGVEASPCAHLQLVRKGTSLRIVDEHSGAIVDQFDNVKTTVNMRAAGSGPWQGRDDDGQAKTIERVDCAVIVTFAEESTLLVWRDRKGRWHRLWLAD